MIFRLLVLALLIFWGVWVFQSCEKQPQNTDVIQEEIMSDDNNDPHRDNDEDTREDEDVDDKKEGNTSALELRRKALEERKAQAEADKARAEREARIRAEQEEKQDRVSILDKMLGRDTPETVASKTTTKTTTTNTSHQAQVVNVGTQGNVGSLGATIVTPTTSVVRQVTNPERHVFNNVPDRDTYVRLYVYDDRVDSFGDQFTQTGRVHFEVINFSKFPQKISIPDCDLMLGKVSPGEKTYMGFEPVDPQEYVVVAQDNRKEKSVSIQVVQ